MMLTTKATNARYFHIKSNEGSTVSDTMSNFAQFMNVLLLHELMLWLPLS